MGGGATFHCLFSSTICSSAFYLAWKKTQKLETCCKVFFSLLDGQMEGNGLAGNTLVDRPTELICFLDFGVNRQIQNI